jgi:uncharacterized membrane protein (UPF0127 family)
MIKHYTRPRSLALTASTLVLLACGTGTDDAARDPYRNLMAFDSASIRLVGRDTTRLTVELAESESQRTMGLMERRQLAPDAGMLFIYSTVQPESSAFWMFRTRIPLDIAFIDSTGVIRTIRTMQPCPSPLAQGCPSYPAGARYIAAIEANAGYFAERGLAIGDRVILADTANRHPTARSDGR